MGNAQEILNRMMSRLERAIAMGSGQGARQAKAELGGALELAMEKAGLTVPVVGARGVPEDLPRVLSLLEK